MKRSEKQLPNKQTLATFWNLIALILIENNVNRITVTKIVKEI